jgi:hypothetical protein
MLRGGGGFALWYKLYKGGCAKRGRTLEINTVYHYAKKFYKREKYHTNDSNGISVYELYSNNDAHSFHGFKYSFKMYYFHIFSRRMQRRASTCLMEWNTLVKYFNLNILKFCIFCKVEHSL